MVASTPASGSQPLADSGQGSDNIEPIAAAARERYASVAVDTPAHPKISSQEDSGALLPQPRVQAFHYFIPTELAARVQIGQWVWVPFGSRHLSGIIVALDVPPPDIKLRPISAIIDDRPVLSQRQLALAEWISEHYLTPLFQCLRLFLPPGSAPISETIYRLGPVEIPGLTPTQKQIAVILAERGPLTQNQLADALIEQHIAQKHRRRSGIGSNTISALVRKGAVERISRLQPPRSRPQYQKYLRLAVDNAAAQRRLAQFLARSQAERALLFLAEAQEAGDPLLPVDELAALSGVKRATLKTMTAHGEISVLPGNVLWSAKRRIGEAQGLSDQAAALLAELRQDVYSEKELTKRGYSAADCATLLAKGLAEKQESPESAYLTLAPETIYERILAKTSGGKWQRALAVLAQQSAPIWVHALREQSGCTTEQIDKLVQAGVAAIEERRFYRDPFIDMDITPVPPPVLNEEQVVAVEPVLEALKAGAGKAFLLHGVTGSGKTEAYLKAIEQTIALGKQAIVLVPEIALTPQTVRRFAARFPGRIAVQHSRLSEGERYDQWCQIRDGAADVVIGSRSALFAPLPDCALVVMDEEHESSYKQEGRPYYHARDVALKMAEKQGCVVILGSATPDICTYRAAERGSIGLLTLKHRYGPLLRWAELPPVQVVDMREELRAGQMGMFSRVLLRSLGEVLARREQAILFLNRRGTATFVMCRDCGYVANCPRCDLPLTYHLLSSRISMPGKRRSAGESNQVLLCHHCNHAQATPQTCPQCGSGRIRFFGAGTEKLEVYTHSIFPEARLIRWDYDTTRAKGGHDVILQRFLKHEADILIGTQMIAKGLDLPLVTLVGVVAADTAMFFPDYRAGERTFQLLTQVAGRAGRSALGGQAIVQTYHPDHYAIKAASRHDYVDFYEQERQRREQLGYPPYGELIRLTYIHSNGLRCREESEHLAERLRLRIRQLGLPNLEVIGPSPCFFERLRGQYRWNILLRGQEPAVLLANEAIPLGWRIDVDPVSFL